MVDVHEYKHCDDLRRALTRRRSDEEADIHVDSECDGVSAERIWQEQKQHSSITAAA